MIMKHGYLFVGLICILLVSLMGLSACAKPVPSKAPTPISPPTPTPAPPPTPTPTPIAGVSSSSDIATEPSVYDGKKVAVSGQTYLTGNMPKLLVDGKSGINITGNTTLLQGGVYRMTGIYNANTNTLEVIESVREEVKYLAIEAGKKLGINLVPVAVQGLIATTPKEVTNMLTSYLSILNFPKDVPIYPYVVYTKDALYLALSDALIQLPAQFTFLYQGKDYSFTFCAGEVKGTLIKTPIEKINFGPKWESQEFGGVIIANIIATLEPIGATVKEINANPTDYTFKRVAVDGSYIVTTATIDYSEIKAPMGQGILADEFADFFKEDTKLRLETIDPNRKVWQLRRGKVIGTVMYPTEQILKHLDYSAPITKSEIKERLKPALIVDTLVDEVEKVANISELNPIFGEPSKYWGKVAEFDGYALGINYPLKKVAEAILKTEVPVNVNLLAVGIADSADIGSQLAIIGLNNELINEKGESIKGKYEFRVAVSSVSEELVSGAPYVETAFFLLSKKELPIEIPTRLYSLSISISPSAGGSVTPPGGKFVAGTKVVLTAVPALGYVFRYWSGNVSETCNPITIVMNCDKSITAHFEYKTYDLTVYVDPPGSGSILFHPFLGLAAPYPAGTKVTLTAIPNPGYTFLYWSGGGTWASIVITMDSDKQLTACFKLIP